MKRTHALFGVLLVVGIFLYAWAHAVAPRPIVKPAPPPPVEPSLKLAKTTFAQGERITVTFTAPAAYYSQGAWIGLIPQDVAHGSGATNDANDVAHETIRPEQNGVIPFTAPSQPGAWSLRLNDSGKNGKEVASVSFTVTATPAAAVQLPQGKPSLKLAQTTFAPGEPITVTFTASGEYPREAWVGLVPANISHGDEGMNDANAVARQSIGGRTGGTMTFSAPRAPGAWDVRMNDSDAKMDAREVASATFTVTP